MNHTARYSIVVPIYNEEHILPILWQRLENVIKQLDGPCEVIFIDDGSTDTSLHILISLRSQHPKIKVISLSRNFGHQSALSAGIDHAEGQAVILMDGDLQDPPEAIPTFIQTWKQGYGVVYAIRTGRKEPMLKRLAFLSFYRLQSLLAGMTLPLDAGVFSLMDRRAILALRSMPERNKYLSGLRSYAGFKQIGIPVERDSRYWGKPRVSIWKLLKLAFDGIFSFSKVPLRLATFFGLFCAVVSFCIGLVGLYYKVVLGQQFLSWAYGLTSIFFLGGIQLFALGIIGEYIGRIYDEVKQRPYYIIEKKIGFDE